MSRGRNHLSQEEKIIIYNTWRSGRYYQKELCEMFNITNPTLNKVISEITHLFKEMGVIWL